MRQILIRFVLVCALASLTSSSEADQFKAPSIKHGAPVSIQGYGAQNHACMAWTNGCVLCRTDETGRSQCSTPGIACQPAGITCKSLHLK